MSNEVLTPQELTSLELLLDTVGFSNLVSALENICREKSSHIQANWQDEYAAKVWDNRANLLDRLRNRLSESETL